MSFLDSFFANNKTVSVEVQVFSQTFINGVLGEKVWTTDTTFEALFWRGAMAEKYVSDRYKADVSGMVIGRPEEVPEIAEDSRLFIGGDYYSIIYRDDIAEQGKVVQIPVKKWFE